MRDFGLQKRVILTLLSLLVAADIALAVYSYQLAAAPFTPEKALKSESLKLQVKRKDIESAQNIKDNMPGTRSDCEKFERGLPLERVGSSSMTSDLDNLAAKAGLHIVSLTSKQKEVSGRPITEMQIEMTINGDYAGVARFINGLQRTDKFYIVDELSLTETQSKAFVGGLSVALHLRTYFREAA